MTTEDDDIRRNRNTLRSIRRAMRFPKNTDPSLRHLLMMAECLAQDKPYGMFEDERRHCAGSMLVVVLCLLQARNELHRLTGEYWPERDARDQKRRMSRLSPPAIELPDGSHPTSPSPSTPSTSETERQRG